MKNFGNEIGRLLKERGLTRKDLAIKLSMTEANIYKILKKESVDTKFLQKISELLDIPLSYWFEDVGSNFSNNKIAYGENSNIVQGKGNVIHGAIQGNKVHKVTKDAEASPEIRNMLSELELENKYLKQKVKDLEILIAQKEMLIEEKERMIQLLMGARGT